MNEEQALDAKEELLDEIKDTRWSVEECNFESDMWDGISLSLELEYQDEITVVDSAEQRTRIKSVKQIISDLSDGQGAHIDTVIGAVEEELDTDPETVKAEIEKLRRQGDVYEPATDHFRVV